MARKISPAMKPWLKFGYVCAKAAGVKNFKKRTPAQKKAVKACVMSKARAAGMKIAGK
jgi:hypothetical protein